MSAALPAIREEVIQALREAEAPLTRAELLDLCPTAENAQWVSIALNTLKKTGVVERTEHGWTLTVTGRGDPGDNADVSREDEARAIEQAPYQRLEHRTAAPRPVETSAAPQPVIDFRPPQVHQDDADPLLERIRHMREAKPIIAEAERKARILRVLACWPAIDDEVAKYLFQIAADLEGLAA